jgi:hypothetical protein
MQGQSGFFDLVSSVYSVILGLSIVRICYFFGSLMIVGRSKFYTRTGGRMFISLPTALTVAWSTYILHITLEFWYSSLRWKGLVFLPETFGHFMVSLAFPVILSLVTFVLCPNSYEERFNNLGEHFKQNSYLLYFLIGMMLFVAGFQGYLYRPEPFEYKYENAFRWGLGTACLMLSVAKSKLGDKVDIVAPLVPILGFVANIAYIQFVLR